MFKAHRLLYHLALSSRMIKKRRRSGVEVQGRGVTWGGRISRTFLASSSIHSSTFLGVQGLGCGVWGVGCGVGGVV